MMQFDLTMPRLFAEGTSELRINLQLESGSLTALVGPSGSGKTTILRLLAGLETPARGRIIVDRAVWLDTEKNVNLRPQQRSIGYVFQDTALFPNMTVGENIYFAAPAGEQQRVQELIDATGLSPFIRQKPARLSGGQRQRVALARALVRRPKLLLLDEPFAALDAPAAQRLRQALWQLHQRWGTTTLLVSHHETDIKTLADRVVRLRQGQVDSDEPVAQFVAGEGLTEPVLHIQFDPARQLWLIETSTSRLESVHPFWATIAVGDRVQIAGISTRK